MTLKDAIYDYGRLLASPLASMVQRSRRDDPQLASAASRPKSILKEPSARKHDPNASAALSKSCASSVDDHDDD